jgi:hypothetical protein
LQQTVCLIGRDDPATIQYLTIEQGSGANLPELLVYSTSVRWTSGGKDEEKKFVRVPGVMTERAMYPVYVEEGPPREEPTKCLEPTKCRHEDLAKSMYNLLLNVVGEYVGMNEAELSKAIGLGRALQIRRMRDMIRRYEIL